MHYVPLKQKQQKGKRNKYFQLIQTQQIFVAFFFVMFERLFNLLFRSKSKEAHPDSEMKYLIVGLGNIGASYENTRHNIGFKIADALAADLAVQFSSERYGALATAKHKGRIYLILKPNTFMNLSGQAIKYWMQKEKIDLEHLLVILDDLHIDFGTVRTKLKGGSGGHNGLKSIEAELSTVDYYRMRVGIGDSFMKGNQVDFVLGNWTDEEFSKLQLIQKHCVSAIKTFGFLGIEKMMSEFNKKITL